MQNQIFIIAGESGSGKTSSALLLKNYHEIITNNCEIVLLAFADELKILCAEFLNNFYNPPEPFSAIMMNNSEYKEKKWNYTFQGKPMTIRNVLITIGMRMRQYNPDFWVDIIINKIKTHQSNDKKIIFIIHDNRFLNEAEKIFASFKGTHNISGLRIIRENSVTQHNENEIDEIAKLHNYKIINNNGTYNELIEQLRNAIIY
jgi:ABC-type glutathione transport system ATPase component